VTFPGQVNLDPFKTGHWGRHGHFHWERDAEAPKENLRGEQYRSLGRNRAESSSPYERAKPGKHRARWAREVAQSQPGGRKKKKKGRKMVKTRFQVIPFPGRVKWNRVSREKKKGGKLLKMETAT